MKKYIGKSLWIVVLNTFNNGDITFLVAANDKKECRELITEQEEDYVVKFKSINKIGNLAPKYFEENYPSWDGESTVILSSIEGAMLT